MQQSSWIDIIKSVIIGLAVIGCYETGNMAGEELSGWNDGLETAREYTGLIGYWFVVNSKHWLGFVEGILTVYTMLRWKFIDNLLDRLF